MPRPDPSEHAPHHASYIDLVPEGDVVAALRSDLAATLGLLRGLGDAEAMTRHPPYTWSLKEVVGHILDCERIFGYRALRFARGDATELPGFEENGYARAAGSDARSLEGLLEEFEALRRSHILFFDTLPPEAWDRRGTANGTSVSVRAIAYIMAGHERHHLGIVRKRLGKS